MTDTEEPRVEREEQGQAGRYVIHLGPDAEAEMTFRRVAPGIVAVDHTFTPPAFRGHDIALKLMTRLLEDARTEGFRIIPICSYVASQFKRHPEWSDLLAGRCARLRASSTIGYAAGCERGGLHRTATRLA